MQDLHTLGVSLTGSRVLLLGAGGAARGCIGALLAAQPEELVIHNRTEATARQLANDNERYGEVHLLSDVSRTSTPEFDLVINATSASLAGAQPDIDHTLLQNAVCYDMMYGASAQPFLKWAGAQGASALHDGLGMLIEQAAASFLLWHEVRPDTAPVREMLARTQPKTR